MDDHHLASLLSSTPSRCILLLEDIDCAFPSRDDDESDDDGEQYDEDGNRKPSYQPWTGRTSEVTLSGLLNALDSVTSEEGRITFATTNHIEALDPALIRAGRMDVKIEYKLATEYQIEQTFLRFFERTFVQSQADGSASSSAHVQAPRPSFLSGFSDDKMSTAEELLPLSEVYELASAFSKAIPAHTFALAQVQGYLLTKKCEPRGAVRDAEKWVEEQMNERKRIEELKEKKKARRRERAAARRAEREKEKEERNKDGDGKESKSEGDEQGDVGSMEDAAGAETIKVES